MTSQDAMAFLFSMKIVSTSQIYTINKKFDMKNIETFESFINEEFGNEVSEKMNAGFKAYLDKHQILYT